MGNYFAFNGISCSYAGVVLKESLGMMIPAQRGEEVAVAGRDGKLWIDENAADSMDKTLQIWIPPTSDILFVRNWLRGSGRLKLEEGSLYSYDARISGMIDYLPLNGGGGWSANVPVSLSPYATLDEEAVITVANGATVKSTAPVRTYVRLLLQGSGDAVINMGNRQITLPGISNGTVIDGVAREAYIGSTLRSGDMEGEWPYLDPGETVITYSGGVSSLKIGAQWPAI